MLTLAITSATAQTAVALVRDGTLLAGFTCGSDRRHAEVLAPAIGFCCEHAGVRLADVELVAVDVGPGLYTGLRVGLATSRAIAHAFDVPLVGVTSLEAQAQAHRAVALVPAGSEIVSVIDARRGEVFWAAYGPPTSSDYSDPLTVIIQPQVSSPVELAARLADGSSADPRVAIGEGLRRCREELAHIDGLTLGSEAGPSALVVARIAERELAARSASGNDDGLADFNSVRPVYLRTPDAKANFEVRGAATS